MARYLLQSLTLLLWSCLLVTAQEPEISPDGDATLWYPVPSANGSRITINAIDTLVVSYEAKWPLVNISMWCLTNNAVQDPYTGIDLQSPRVKKGNYILGNVNNYVKATVFPIPCHFAMTASDNAAVTFAGGTFTMTSTAGPETTWSRMPESLNSLSATGARSTTLPAASQTGGSSASITGSHTSSTIPGPSSTLAPASSPKPRELSGGAIAGIVVGVFGLVCVSVAIWFLRKRVRSKASATSGNSAHESGRTNTQMSQGHFSDRTETTSMSNSVTQVESNRPIILTPQM